MCGVTFHYLPKDTTVHLWMEYLVDNYSVVWFFDFMSYSTKYLIILYFYLFGCPVRSYDPVSLQYVDKQKIIFKLKLNWLFTALKFLRLRNQVNQPNKHIAPLIIKCMFFYFKSWKYLTFKILLFQIFCHSEHRPGTQ